MKFSRNRFGLVIFTFNCFVITLYYSDSLIFCVIKTEFLLILCVIKSETNSLIFLLKDIYNIGLIRHFTFFCI